MSEKTILFGIKNCDSVKAAKSWLESKQLDYDFHDFRVDGLSKDQLQTWIDQVGSETLINKRSATWRQLSTKDQDLALGQMASAVVLANPTLIKRPVLQRGESLLVGFSNDEYEAFFS